VEEGEAVEVILDRTPFYPEGGGQVADTGVIVSDGGRMVVESVMRVAGGLIVHRGRVVSGVLRVGDEIRAQVDAETRLATARNHTATHLLHKALQEVLGEHAKQAGSLVAPDRLRFDFTHFKPLTRDELAEIERRVNAAILEDLPVTTIITSLAEAQAMGGDGPFRREVRRAGAGGEDRRVEHRALRGSPTSRPAPAWGCSRWSRRRASPQACGGSRR